MKIGIGRYSGGARLERHRHANGYLAIVLTGAYVEAGDCGRLRVAAGDAVSHGCWSTHRDDFAPVGASVLNLPLPAGAEEFVGKVVDIDAVARLAELDEIAAVALALDGMVTVDAGIGDWPDMLATELTDFPDLPLAAWADLHGIAATSLSRGFAAAYGISPKLFRLEQRTRRALRELPHWRGTLAGLAVETGFADQAHLARSTRILTGRTPRSFR